MQPAGHWRAERLSAKWLAGPVINGPRRLTAPLTKINGAPGAGDAGRPQGGGQRGRSPSRWALRPASPWRSAHSHVPADPSSKPGMAGAHPEASQRAARASWARPPLGFMTTVGTFTLRHQVSFKIKVVPKSGQDVRAGALGGLRKGPSSLRKAASAPPSHWPVQRGSGRTRARTRSDL